MKVRLLGPVAIETAGRSLACARPQQSVVLAALIADAGRAVPVETLIDRVWGDDVPNGARRTLHTHIARIRAMLRQASDAAGADLDVVRDGGYVLRVPPDRVDLFRFRALVADAGEPGCPVDRRATLLREALDLWQAEPMTGLAGQWVDAVRAAWCQERLDAVVAWACAELERGSPAAVIARVGDMLTAHPLAESLAVVLMRALYVAGRGAEALECFAAVRERLADELGADPGPELQTVHQAILRGEPEVGASAAASAQPQEPEIVPAQLPADTTQFTGREAELSALDAVSAEGGAENGTAPAIAVVSGPAGVGKTALALRWAHLSRHRFQHGQLYANLRGYDPDQPVPAEEVLARFLRALGVAEQEIPPSLDDRTARFRTAIADRRILVVLDNAADVEHVRPLLPGSPTCAVVVTSRDRLSGLVAAHGGRRVEVAPLPQDESVELVRRLSGARVENEPAATTALVQHCGRLPLALRVAAELVDASPGSSVALLVDELGDQQRRLDLLDAGGDPRAGVTAVFSWSLRHLPAEVVRVFRVLGLHPGQDFDVHAIAALAGCDVRRAAHAAERLERAHLLQGVGSGRYAMHDLLRSYAGVLARDEDTAVDRAAAIDRLLGFYAATATEAVMLMYPAEHRHRRSVEAESVSMPELADAHEAHAWLDDERANLMATAAYAVEHDRPGHCVVLSINLFRYLDSYGHLIDALALHERAERAAEPAGDRAGQGHAALGVGVVRYRLGLHEDASVCVARALELFEDAEELIGQGRAHGARGLIDLRSSRFEQSIASHGRALALFEQAGDTCGQARALANLGHAQLQLGRWGDAVEHTERALALHREVGSTVDEATALSILGALEEKRGRYERAIQHSEQALALYRRIDSSYGEAGVLDGLASLHVRLGSPREAIDEFEGALTLFRELDEPYGEASALNGLGDAMLALGDTTAAIEHYDTALGVAAGAGGRDQEARAHAGLSDAHRQAGDGENACLHHERALALYQELGMPEAEELRSRAVEA